MLVLALDTTTRQGSIAVVRGGRPLDVYRGDATVTHGERLPGDLLRRLAALGLRASDVDLFAVAAGPGSFTGLRIGIASMQGLALAHGRPLSGVSALDAWNEAVYEGRDRSSEPALTVAVWMDAQRRQVFSGLYRGAEAIDPPMVDLPADVLGRWTSMGMTPDVFIGDGAVAYAALIEARSPDSHIRVEPLPLAPSIARLAVAEFERHGPSAPDAIRPIYVRRSDAELARDRRVAPAARVTPS